MNPRIKDLIKTSLNTLKTQLTPTQLFIIKNKLTDVSNNKISIAEAYSSMQKSSEIPDEVLSKICDSLYQLGMLVAIPRTGATDLMRKCYKEDTGKNVSWSEEYTGQDISNDIKDFIDYRQDLIKDALTEIMGGLST